MKIWKQLFLTAVLLTAAGGGFHAYQTYFVSGDGNSGKPSRRGGSVSVIVKPVIVQNIDERIEAVGTTRALQSVNIVSLASGRVEEINFQSGQNVEKGDILLSLDADIERANLEESEANLKEAKQALERARSLQKNNTVSQAQFDQIVSRYTVSKAARDRAARRYSDRTVRAPFAGITGLQRVDIGARIDDDTVVTTLDDLTKVEVEFQLPEIFYGRVRRGQHVTAASAAFPDRIFEAAIANVDSRIDETARAFRVRAVMPNPDLILPAGMFMTITVVMGSRDAMMIPEAAVVFEGSEPYVYIVADDKAQRRTVELGLRRRDLVEVTDGLESGDLVVQRGTEKLRNGSAVAIVETEGGSDNGETAKSGKPRRSS